MRGQADASSMALAGDSDRRRGPLSAPCWRRGSLAFMPADLAGSRARGRLRGRAEAYWRHFSREIIRIDGRRAVDESATPALDGLVRLPTLKRRCFALPARRGYEPTLVVAVSRGAHDARQMPLSAACFAMLARDSGIISRVSA